MSKKYKSYSKEDKLSLLCDYYQSGLSKYSFCKSRGIAAPSRMFVRFRVKKY